MASSKSSATICDLFLIFNLLFFTFGTSSLTSIPVLHPPTPAATPPRSVQPGSGGHAPAPTPASPAPGNGGHGVPIPNPITPPASPAPGNGGHGVPTPQPITPPASPPSGNGHGGPSPPASPPSGNGGQCPVKLASLKVCAGVLNGLVSVNGPCCPLINGLASLDAEVCLCAAIKANVLGYIQIDATVAVKLIVGSCGKPTSPGFKCPN
ncbi:lipid transfer protein EARLI 1-like [Dioscorea cayenensis subsp. rotundata]|uniref:Lipid transfer protein EARLI 1-like n=1 Tax=Dioscorea cayennensis subsp. rotundata TaxID=55577 RepID=A0AB40CPS6_DIOCR|nr:lipid transfer protein EARLI 1-like [Dioscorea cayenensis subsp. rotundata]